jgi:NadR type nicotinamide-nucleotide adenylyltransferase
LKKIVLIGPESTGKSTLGNALAAHFNGTFVPEYARAYLTKHGTQYSYANLLTIAQGQLLAEDVATAAATKNNTLLFIDTDMQVLKVWCEFVFNQCHNFILNQIVTRQYDLYLLCNTDLPWAKDDLREYPDLPTREKLFNHYKDILINQNTPWVEIAGKNEERLYTAIKAVQKILTK